MIAGWFGFDATQIEEVMADPSLVVDQASEAIRQEMTDLIGVDFGGADAATSTDVTATSTEESSELWNQMVKKNYGGQVPFMQL